MASSGDLLADRRYAYAQAMLEEGDHAAAIDLARQALELAPGFAPAWFLIGQAHEAVFRALDSGADASGEYRDAVSAYETARALDPEDRLGAGLRLGAMSVGDPLVAMSPAYVRQLFDDYAIRFERQLRQSLKYRGPELLHDAVRRACSRRLRPFAFAQALDLGCGTGLAGEAFRPECRHLAGIDLSSEMVRRARAKRLYDDLATGDLLAWLDEQPDASADLVLAADVFVYLGDLAPVFSRVARVLRRDGLFAFTVQAHPGEGVRLGEDGRYAHAEPHLHALADAAGLGAVIAESVSTRQDRGVDVPGWLLILGR